MKTFLATRAPTMPPPSRTRSALPRRRRRRLRAARRQGGVAATLGLGERTRTTTCHRCQRMVRGVRRSRPGLPRLCAGCGLRLQSPCGSSCIQDKTLTARSLLPRHPQTTAQRHPYQTSWARSRGLLQAPRGRQRGTMRALPTAHIQRPTVRGCSPCWVCAGCACCSAGGRLYQHAKGAAADLLAPPALPRSAAFTAEATAEELQQAAAAAARQERERQKRRAAELLSGGDGEEGSLPARAAAVPCGACCAPALSPCCVCLTHSPPPTPHPPDAYAECYPSYYDAGTVVEDSDEEGAAPADQVHCSRPAQGGWGRLGRPAAVAAVWLHLAVTRCTPAQAASHSHAPAPPAPPPFHPRSSRR